MLKLVLISKKNKICCWGLIVEFEFRLVCMEHIFKPKYNTVT